MDPLAIELVAIQNMGKWKNKRGEKCGNGLAHHVKEAVRLLWPENEWHKWNELMFDQFCKPGRTAVFGPSSSSKSWTFSQFILVMFYARPHGTTGIVSSTTLDALKRRIWGYVVSLDKKARAIYPWLPGSLIESKNMLLADASTADGRSYANGIIGVACKRGGRWQGIEEFCGSKNEVFILGADECFPAGTLVDTPNGEVPIEQIKSGDEVASAIGTSIVTATSCRVSDKIISLKTKSGIAIRCTQNHPFLTQLGWKKACELNQSHFILSTNEAMRIMRGENCQEKFSLLQTAFLRKQLLSEVVAKATRSCTYQKEKEAATEMRVMRKPEGTFIGEVLQSELCVSMGAQPTRNREGKNREVSHRNDCGSQAKSRLGKENLGNDEQQKSYGESRHSIKGFRFVEGDWSQTSNPRRERHRAYASRTGPYEVVPGSYKQLRSENRNVQRQRFSYRLQGGLRIPKSEVSGGGRWIIPQQSNASRSGCKEDYVFNGDWVDRVEIQKQADTGRGGVCGGRTEVYNLQVDGHPSYSVSGLLVHNCHFMPSGFWDALANLESNGVCFAVALGNLPDVSNPLATAAEPKLGWESLPDTEKTRVYETRWFNGRAIQLIGVDSPNMEYPEGQEPFKNLIGRRYIDQCAYNYGRESDKFNMFASGKIPRSSMNRTVFTKSQCIKFHAMDQVTWGHHELVRGYGIDAAYSGVGGDRTIGFPFAFGKDNTGMWRLWFGRMVTFMGSDSPKMTHAEAIVHQCKQECDAAGIPPEHVFYDGTGRSELTIAFARLWSSKVIPLEFGGPATDRPSFTGEKHFHGEQLGEVKTCREAFDRFVSELWFASSYCITSDQMRGITEEAIEEGSQRKWELVRGAKQCIETKDDMKERGLRSPDIWDSVVVCCEGARRLGFPLGKTTTPNKASTNRWLEGMREEQWKRLQKEQLAA